MVFPGEALDPLEPAFYPCLALRGGFIEEPRKRRGDSVDALGIEGERDVPRDLAQGAVVRAGAGDSPRHRLDERKPEALEEAGEDIKPRLGPDLGEFLAGDETGEADERGVRRPLRRLVHDFGILPVRAGEDERMRRGGFARQARIRLDEPHVVLARMLDAGDVEETSGARGAGRGTRIALTSRVQRLTSTQTIVQHRHVIFAAVPELHHVGLGRAAHRDEVLRLLRVVGEDMREVEHPEARVLAGDVEIREVMHRRRRRQRVERADAAVGGADEEAVEVAAVPADPERQHEEVPEHRQRRTPRPARGGNRWYLTWDIRRETRGFPASIV